MSRAAGGTLGRFDLDPARELPLYRQLYGALRDRLASGAIPAGQRLRSTRALAQELGVSRNTVQAAFDRLIDEGLIESRVGAGCFAASAWIERPPRTSAEGAPAPSATQEVPRLSRLGRSLVGPLRGLDATRPRPFSLGVPALGAFPLTRWSRLLARRARRTEVADLASGPPTGIQRLRDVLAQDFLPRRGVRCEPAQILVLPSAQLGLDLCARLLVDPGDVALVEDPGYLGARAALQAVGATLEPLTIGVDGARFDRLPSAASDARVAYLTPSHQFPLGVAMTLERRLQALAWAERARAWIVEDDYDSAFRHDGRPVQALQGLDRDGRVLYLGTLSKILFPSLRLAYLVVPEALVDVFVAARFRVDGHVAVAIQEAVADFVADGHLASHLRRMGALYRERRDLLVEQCERRFGGHFRLAGGEAGLHLALVGPEPSADHLAVCAERFDLDLSTLSTYALASPIRGLALGYGHLSPAEILAGSESLERALDAHRPGRTDR
ncbi:MAG: PLP-dependent aminotransferase family protein [Acidobacteriota bacterium]